MRTVGVSELRQNLSRYLQDVKAGEALLVTERGREVARLIPSGVRDDPIARLAAQRGATLPSGSLCDVGDGLAPAAGPPSGAILDVLRGERV